MNEIFYGSEKPYWQMKKRSIYLGVPIFKMKLNNSFQSLQKQYQKPDILFPLTKANKIVAYSSDLQTLRQTYQFQAGPHAFQIMKIGKNNQEPKSYLVAGSTDGKIMCQPLTSNSQTLANQLTQKFTLNTDGNKKPQQVYINDILDLGRGKIANCFNNGTLAFWNMAQRKRIHSMQKVHSSYTYKLKRIDERLISCGHDGMAVVTDLNRLKRLRSLQNADSCWCSYPVNYNVIASVGLFNRVNIWDVRTRSLIQSAVLENGQSSFITAFDRNSLVFGDGNLLKKCDLRTMTCTSYTSQSMLLSAQGIIVTKNGGYACGRRNEICYFQGVDQLNIQIKAQRCNYNPFMSGQMLLFNENNNDGNNNVANNNLNPMQQIFMHMFGRNNFQMQDEDEDQFEQQQLDQWEEQQMSEQQQDQQQQQQPQQQQQSREQIQTQQNRQPLEQQSQSEMIQQQQSQQHQQNQQSSQFEQEGNKQSQSQQSHHPN